MSTNIHTLSKTIRFSEKNSKSFTKWSESGAQSSDSDVNKLIKECVKDIQEQIVEGFNDVNPSAFRVKCSTIVTCIAYKKDSRLYEITVVVARDYFSAVVEEFDPFDVPEFAKVKQPELQMEVIR
jgi:phosphosulfolactate synthase (CoM biosynthesis protein A)